MPSPVSTLPLTNEEARELLKSLYELGNERLASVHGRLKATLLKKYGKAFLDDIYNPK